MAGNHREWAANPDGEARYNLGGGWNDPEYAFNDAITSLAFDRNDQNGIRISSYPDDRNVAAASRPLQKAYQDFRAIKPVSDEVFEVYRQMYEYDEAPLNAELIETLEGAAYVREQIEIDAAYNNERLTVMVFLPTASSASPPYQTVMFFPGSGDIYKTSYDELTLGRVEFILKSGRALIYPVYKGTYDRNSGLKTYVPDTSNQYRDFMIAQSKDLGRAIDYVESRADLDADRLAYIGISWGSKLGPIMVAMEKRLKTAVFFVGGLSLEEAHPMADPFNFLPRVTIPTFMFNGRYDSFFPLESSVMPMYENLGTPEADKKLTVTDANHFVAAYNKNQMISEALDWLDKYLGAVE
jgi:pimeloyl-ACP methyl ester carboxylesterase